VEEVSVRRAVLLFALLAIAGAAEPMPSRAATDHFGNGALSDVPEVFRSVVAELQSARNTPRNASHLAEKRTTKGPTRQGTSATPSPFVGSWTANLSKSERDPNHQFESATLRFEVEGNTVTLTHGGVNASGQQESGVTTLEADGKEHPIPEAPGVVVVTRWVGSRGLETVAKKGDQTVGRGIYEVSHDGRTLTATVSGTDARGNDFEQVIVFDRD
jgi:hypothetical protein